MIACLEPIWYDLPDSARRIRLRIRAVLDYAVEMEVIPLNVERGITKLSLPPQPKTKEHFAALIPGDVPAAYRKIGKSKSLPATRLAFQFLIHNRLPASGEVRGATWAEIDGDTWTIPAERMKAGKEHIVPLSIQAQVLLREAREKLGGDGLIFPGEGGNPLSDNALSLRARKEGFGLRTARLSVQRKDILDGARGGLGSNRVITWTRRWQHGSASLFSHCDVGGTKAYVPKLGRLH